MGGRISSSVSFGRLSVDASKATWGDEPIALTPTETLVLRELARSAPMRVTREELCLRVYGDARGCQRMDVHISHIRPKLASTSVRIPPASRGGAYALVHRGPAVCLVEDHAALARTLRSELERAVAASVDVKSTFAEARASVERRECQVVVVDVVLGDAPRGVELASLAKANGIAAILISGSERFAANAFALQVPFLLKPFTATTLCTLVRGALAASAVKPAGGGR